MGRNSKARRDARKRKQGNQQAGQRTRPGPQHDFEDDDAFNPVAFAEFRLSVHVRRLGARGSADEARDRAASLLRELPLWALTTAAAGLLDRVLAPTLRGGWSPAELADAVDRVVGPGQRPAVAGVITAIRRFIPTHAGWDAELAALGRPRQLVLAECEDLALALRLTGLFNALPVSALPRRPLVAAPGAGSSKTSAKLEQVRLLLAKAEATSFPEEAEALSTKAQELISKHSLEQLIAQDASDGRRKQTTTTYRRVWLEAPYVDAKASLVDAVSRANRCRAIYSSTLGFCTVVGAAFDIDAVELLVTSLLAQAQRAMLRHGSRTDSVGRSRTRSFRQSFLASFAVHIGERLTRAAEESVAAAGGSALLPVLRGHDAEVNAMFDAMFPDVIEKSSSITNAEGWAGGKLAAELAELDIFEAVRA